MSTQNYFELFGLAPSFNIDVSALRSAYRQLQTQHHPDNFASESDQRQLQAVQYAALINDAYQCLSHPVSRATYLVEQFTGEPVEANNLRAEPAFLMQQIEARERIESFIEDGGDYDQLMDLIEQYQAQLDEQYTVFNTAMSSQNWPQATMTIAKMQLFSKLLAEANELEDKLD